MIGVTCLVTVCLLSYLMYYLKNIFKTYRHKLEIYQVLLVEFIPDKVSELAVAH